MLTIAACGRGSAIRARPSSVELEAVAELQRDDRDAVDQGEGVEADAGGEPERAAARPGSSRPGCAAAAIGSAGGDAPGSSAWISG